MKYEPYGQRLRRNKILSEIEMERDRQIEKGFDFEHDKRGQTFGRSDVAAVYALSTSRNIDDSIMQKAWPNTWDPSWFRPEDNRTNLIKAAALIIAEIEMLDYYAEGGHDQ